MKKLSSLLFGSYARMLVFVYFAFALIGALLLMLPWSLNPEASLTFTDAFFTAVSGVSTTGLSTIDVAATLSVFGKIVLALILQFGGLGIMMMLVSYWLLLGKKIGFRQRSMLFAEQNQVSMSGIIKLIKNIITVIFTAQIIAFIVMGIYLSIVYNDTFGVSGAFFQSFFLSISLITNAGFDIDPGVSMFRYANDYVMQTIAMFLMFIGAVGFWPLAECKEWIHAKRKRQVYRFSYLSKLLIKMHVYLWLISALVFFLFEMNNFLAGQNIVQGTFYSFFMTLSTRNSGFATMNVSELNASTQMMFTVLMFIGASPNSAGGGIRTTTLIITLSAIYSFSIGREQVVIREKAIRPIAVMKAFMVFIGALILVIGSAMLLMATQPQLGGTNSVIFKSVVFEVASAFGTTGQSFGITHELNIFGKGVLIFVMFCGRVGILTLLLLLNTGKVNNNIRYTEAEIMVG